MFYSPLRYPGGKNKLAGFLAKVCFDNKIHGHYIEPFAGGSSVALFLLLEGYIDKITINDKDKSVYAFWHSVLYETEKLCRLIDKTTVDLKEWEIQREIQKHKDDVTLLELGFSTLFLNRTNRSGIIKGGVIGGVKQEGNYKIDCRFNKSEIKNRICQISNNSAFINVFNEDAIDIIEDIKMRPTDERTIFYFDPPYYLKADSLYMNYFKDEHHIKVSEQIKLIEKQHWIVSYDDHEFIEGLYDSYSLKRYSFNHSAFSARQGKEILFFSSQLKQPEIKDYNPINFKVVKNQLSKEIVYKK